jgi:hypothetical protein
LANLRGLYLDESTATSITNGDQIGTMRSAEIVLDWASPLDDCRRAANRILSSTSDLSTWDRWDAFCDTLPFGGTTDLKQAKRDILKANFNPNGRLNKFNPNPSLWRTVDKLDLLAWSTEFNLLPQAGSQDLACVGRVLGKDGRLLASRVLRASVAPADLLTLSTQKEFVCEDLGDLSVAGDEGALRQPGQTPFINRSRGLARTWGHALGLAGLGGRGASLQTFPEPCVDTGSGLSTRAADYDGSVQLATVETPAECMYLVTAPIQDMKLLARYTDDLDLDISDAAPGKPPGDPRWKNQPDVQQVTCVSGLPGDLSQLAYGLLDPTRPNTLYPDGVYSEKDRAPSYFDKDNANGIQGLISFWIKSNHTRPASGAMYRGHPYFKWTNNNVEDPGVFSPDQFFFLGDGGGMAYAIACVFETTRVNANPAGDILKEHAFGLDPAFWPNPALASHRWFLLTMYYDFRSPVEDDCGELLVNAGISGADKDASSTYGNGADPTSAMDITVDHLLPDGSFGPHRLVLGKGRPEIELDVPWFTGSGADATFDELALYDFGGAGPSGIPAATSDTLASPGVLADNRFKEGRYYKESGYPASGGLLQAPGPLRNAGEYFSPSISLGPCRIRSLAWTQVVPAGLPDGRILLELTDAMGGDYLKDASGKPIDQTYDRPTASPVARAVNAPFRLHAVFQPNLADKNNTPVLDPLALDDITVVYEPPEGRRLLTWEQGE